MLLLGLWPVCTSFLANGQQNDFTRSLALLQRVVRFQCRSGLGRACGLTIHQPPNQFARHLLEEAPGLEVAVRAGVIHALPDDAERVRAMNGFELGGIGRDLGGLGSRAFKPDLVPDDPRDTDGAGCEEPDDLNPCRPVCQPRQPVPDRLHAAHSISVPRRKHVMGVE